MKNTIVDILLALTPDAIGIIYWRCRGLTVEETAPKVHMGESTIYKVQNEEIFEAFDVKKWEDVKTVVCKPLQRLAIKPEDLSKWPEGYREKLEVLRESLEPPEETVSEKNTPASSTSQPTESGQRATQTGEVHPRPRLPWIVVAIPILIICVFCIFSAWRILPLLGNLINPTVTTELSTSQVPTNSVLEQSTNTPTVVNTDTSEPTATDTETPSPTATMTLTFTPTPTQTSLPTATATITTESPPELTTGASSGPTGDWAVRTYQTDDANIILVNNHIVGAAFLHQTLDWSGINSLLQTSGNNYITTVNLNNQETNSTWGFSLKHNDVIVWGNEGNAYGCTLCYAQTVQISPDNKVSPVNLRQSDKQVIGGSWSAKIKATDFGIVLVNGVPVAGSYSNSDFGWYDMSGLLYAGQDNIITVAVWNNSGDYSWDAEIQKGDTVVWGTNNNGSGQTGEVFFTTVKIDGDGNVIQ